MGDNVGAARRLGVLLRGQVLSSLAVPCSTDGCWCSWGSYRARMSRAGEAASRGRVGAVQAWLSGRGDSRVGRLAILWFRRYFETSRNSGSAATLYAFLSVMPFVLAVIGLTHAAGGDTNSFAARLIDHLKLTDPTAGLVKETFGAASSNALAATLAGAVGFLIWGLGLGQIYQDVYARAWGIRRSGSAADQGLFAIFFFVLSGLRRLCGRLRGATP